MMKVNQGVQHETDGKVVQVVLEHRDDTVCVLKLIVMTAHGACSTTNTFTMHHKTAIMVHAVLGDMLERLANDNDQQGDELSIDDLAWYPSASGEYCEHDGVTYSYVVRGGYYFVIAKDGASGTEYNCTDVHTNEQAKHYILKLIKEMKND